MAYEKQTWVAYKTPVGAARLNHMEEGIAALSEEIANIPTGKIAPDDTTFFLVFKNTAKILVCH